MLISAFLAVLFFSDSVFAWIGPSANPPDENVEMVVTCEGVFGKRLVVMYFSEEEGTVTPSYRIVEYGNDSDAPSVSLLGPGIVAFERIVGDIGTLNDSTGEVTNVGNHQLIRVSLQLVPLGGSCTSHDECEVGNCNTYCEGWASLGTCCKPADVPCVSDNECCDGYCSFVGLCSFDNCPVSPL